MKLGQRYKLELFDREENRFLNPTLKEFEKLMMDVACEPSEAQQLLLDLDDEVLNDYHQR